MSIKRNFSFQIYSYTRILVIVVPVIVAAALIGAIVKGPGMCGTVKR